MEPVLSVIIPVYNAERTLRTAIDSVIMQRCPDVEIVVVDEFTSPRGAARWGRYQAESRNALQLRAKGGSCGGS